MTRMKFVLTKQLHFCNIATKMKYCTYKNCLVSISIWKVCELAFIVKLQEFTELWQSQMIQVYVPPFKFCVLNWAEISYMNRQQNSSCQLRQPIYWAQMKRPLELHFFFRYMTLHNQTSHHYGHQMTILRTSTLTRVYRSLEQGEIKASHFVITLRVYLA